jgi:hypothetical protein
MLACLVLVGNVSYTKIFESTIDAMIDAMNKFPEATRISVKVIHD